MKARIPRYARASCRLSPCPIARSAPAVPRCCNRSRSASVLHRVGPRGQARCLARFDEHDRSGTDHGTSARRRAAECGRADASRDSDESTAGPQMPNAECRLPGRQSDIPTSDILHPIKSPLRRLPRELLHERLMPLVQLLGREIFLVRRDGPRSPWGRAPPGRRQPRRG